MLRPCYAPTPSSHPWPPPFSRQREKGGEKGCAAYAGRERPAHKAYLSPLPQAAGQGERGTMGGEGSEKANRVRKWIIRTVGFRPRHGR